MSQNGFYILKKKKKKKEGFIYIQIYESVFWLKRFFSIKLYFHNLFNILFQFSGKLNFRPTRSLSSIPPPKSQVPENASNGNRFFLTKKLLDWGGINWNWYKLFLQTNMYFELQGNFYFYFLCVSLSLIESTIWYLHRYLIN